MLPGALYELGVAVVVVAERGAPAGRERAAGPPGPQAPGRATSGFHALRGIAIPVLEDALERSLRLAAAMDSRGYGRTGRRVAAVPARSPAACMLGGMCGLCLGAYGLLDGSAPGSSGSRPWLAGARAVRGGPGPRRPPGARGPSTGPTRGGLPEWVVVALRAGAGRRARAPALATDPAGLDPSIDPLVWPTLPVVPALAILVAGLAAVAAPPPDPLRPAGAADRTARPALGPRPPAGVARSHRTEVAA